MNLRSKQEIREIPKGMFEKQKTISANFIQQFGSLIDDVLLTIDGNLIIKEINGAGIRLLGDNLVGSSLSDKLIYNNLNQEVASCITSGSIIEFSTTPKINEYRHMIGRIMPLSDDRLAVLLMDMTLQHNIEKMRRDFVANVSHELRSPLTSLLGFVETMRNDLEMEKNVRENFLKIMDEEANRMSRLIDDLLSLSRVEIEEHIAPSGQVSIEDAVKSAIDALAYRANTTEHKIQFKDVRQNLSRTSHIRGDLDEINEVFHNLLDNALKYSYPSTTIDVSLSENHTGSLVLAIKNVGDGIDEKHIPRLTERFYRVDKGRSRQMGGTGLGLAIVKHIINKHRGQLIISSQPNFETVFEVHFPYFTDF